MDINVVVDNLKETTGIERVFKEVFKNMKGISINYVSISEISNKDICPRLFFLCQNLFYKKKQKAGKITHFTNQQQLFTASFVNIRGKIIATVYDLFTVMPPYNSELSYFEKMKGFLIKKMIKKADKIITISEYTKKEISDRLHIPQEKIEVIYEAVDHKKFKSLKKNDFLRKKYKINKKEKIILTISSESYRKNLTTLFKAFALLKKKCPHVKLIKGGKPQRPKNRKVLKREIKKLGIEDSVIFTDYIKDDELIKYYNNADLFVIVPLAEGGTALPIFEAMACGLPVITSNIEPLRETVIDSALMVNPLDVEELAKKMQDVLTNKNLGNNQIKKSSTQIKKLSWKESSQQLLKIYRSMLQK